MRAMSYAARIIAVFGGTRAMAAALGRPPSTVQSWKKAGVIPARRHQHVLGAAEALSLRVAPEDFFDAVIPRAAAALPPRGRARASASEGAALARSAPQAEPAATTRVPASVRRIQPRNRNA